MRKLACVLALTSLATPALAESDLTRSTAGYTYFNHAGATQAQHDADLRDCSKLALKMDQPTQNGAAGAAAGGGLIGALVVGIAQGVMNGIAERRGAAANVENCMVVRGWRVVRIDAAEGERLSKLSQPQLSAELGGLVGAETPKGEVARVWDNGVATRSVRTNAPAGDLDKRSLSLTALAPEAAAAQPEPKPARLPRMARTAMPPKPLKPEQVQSAPADSALVVVRLTGGKPQGDSGLTFIRLTGDPKTPAWVDGRPGSVAAKLPVRFFGKRDERLDTNLVFAVPPGRWAVAAMTNGLFSTSFCQGAPAFDVTAGEVVYAGAFAFDQDAAAFGPDLSPEPAKAALPAAVAAKMRPAAYVNGNTFDCGGAYLYAFEAPQAPFAQGYPYGSLAVGAPAQAAAATTGATVPTTSPSAN